MTIMESIDARHSVRAYQEKPIDEETRQQLDRFVAECNLESGLNIFIRYDDPEGFDSRLAHYGKKIVLLSERRDAVPTIGDVSQWCTWTWGRFLCPPAGWA